MTFSVFFPMASRFALARLAADDACLYRQAARHSALL